MFLKISIITTASVTVGHLLNSDSNNYDNNTQKISILNTNICNYCT